jgi:hypothetical protein
MVCVNSRWSRDLAVLQPDGSQPDRLPVKRNQKPADENPTGAAESVAGVLDARETGRLLTQARTDLFHSYPFGGPQRTHFCRSLVSGGSGSGMMSRRAVTPTREVLNDFSLPYPPLKRIEDLWPGDFVKVDCAGCCRRLLRSSAEHRWSQTVLLSTASDPDELWSHKVETT